MQRRSCKCYLLTRPKTAVPPTDYNNAGNIAGFIITDQPVVTMSPNSAKANPGDTVALSAYAIGVPPVSYTHLTLPTILRV